MIKGFLLIDGQMNTIVLEGRWKEFNELSDLLTPANIKKVHRHSKLKELDQDVRAYLKGNYIQEEKEDD